MRRSSGPTPAASGSPNSCPGRTATPPSSGSWRALMADADDAGLAAAVWFRPGLSVDAAAQTRGDRRGRTRPRRLRQPGRCHDQRWRRQRGFHRRIGRSARIHPDLQRIDGPAAAAAAGRAPAQGDRSGVDRMDRAVRCAMSMASGGEAFAAHLAGAGRPRKRWRRRSADPGTAGDSRRFDELGLSLLLAEGIRPSP